MYQEGVRRRRYFTRPADAIRWGGVQNVTAVGTAITTIANANQLVKASAPDYVPETWNLLLTAALQDPQNPPGVGVLLGALFTITVGIGTGNGKLTYQMNFSNTLATPIEDYNSLSANNNFIWKNLVIPAHDIQVQVQLVTAGWGFATPVQVDCGAFAAPTVRPPLELANAAAVG